MRPIINCSVRAECGVFQYMADMRYQWWTQLQNYSNDSDLVLISGGHKISLHQALLVPLSPLLQQLLPVSSCCNCQTPAITLPPVSHESLRALLQLLYTGQAPRLSMEDTEQLFDVLENLQIRIDIDCLVQDTFNASVAPPPGQDVSECYGQRAEIGDQITSTVEVESVGYGEKTLFNQVKSRLSL